MELRFRITDTIGNTLSNAMITVFIGNEQIVGSYSSDSELYTVLVDKPNAKRFKCQIVAEGYETIHHVGKMVNELLHFNLGNIGTTYVPCGNMKIPFEVDEDSIVVIGDIRKFQTDIENKGLKISRMKDKKDQHDFHVFESKAKNKNTRRREHNKSRKEIFDLSPSLETGYLVKDNRTGSSYMMTGEMRIILSKGIAPTKLKKILKEYNCVVKTYFFDQPIIQITTDKKLDIFNVVDNLIEKEIIEQAYPIIHKPRVEEYVPGNNLWPGQYSQHEINVEGAWSVLDTFMPSRKFGLGDIIIGVDDAGLAIKFD